ncbi:MAG: hypothetical protein EP330_07060 [Deltaproteobacteria bacterium]|nr:MAG: hypothetical protein EP330_07060 [Deltaproteobacteria bacterium]
MRGALFLLALTACGGTNVDFTVGDCPADAPVLGQAGTFTVESWDVTWTWARKDRMSWAPPIYAIVPDDITSLAVTVDAGTNFGGFGWLEVGGEVFVDGSLYEGETAWGDAPLYHWPEVAGTVVLPMNQQTWPNPGCMVVLPAVDGNADGESGTVHIGTRRFDAGDGLLDVNLVVVEGVDITQDELDASVAVMRSLYEAGGGPSLGAVNTYTVNTDGGDVIRSEGADIASLRATEVGDGTGLNMFFITDFSDDSGTLGIAAGIPGPIGIPGTSGSGVVLAVGANLTGDGSAVDTQLLGETMAHEAGHQFGLFHSTEETGEHDIIADTPDCPMSADADGDGALYAEECVEHDGANFMFWVAGDFRQDEITATQADMLYYSPATR